MIINIVRRAFFVDASEFFPAIEFEAAAICYEFGAWEYKEAIIDYIYMELIERLGLGFFSFKLIFYPVFPDEMRKIAWYCVDQYEASFHKSMFPLFAKHYPFTGLGGLICKNGILIIPEA